MDDRQESGDRVVIERIFDAPADVVWRMWTEPEHFAAWYGPDGATVPVAKMDVRVGGTRLIGMEVPTPNGPMRMWFTGNYREVVAHRRLVYTESLADEEGRCCRRSRRACPRATRRRRGRPSNSRTWVDAPGWS